MLGAGPIGLIACQVARILGAAHIILSDLLKSRLDAAQAIGIADVYLPAAESGSGAESGNESGEMFDVVMDCAGTAHSTDARSRLFGQAAAFFSMVSTSMQSIIST